MIFTVRQLIREAYIRAGVKSRYETPDGNEAASALLLLNDTLDEFWLDSNWRPGRIEFEITPDGEGKVTFGKQDLDNPDPAIMVDMDPPKELVSCSVKLSPTVFDLMEEMPSDLYYNRTYDGGGYPTKWYYETAPDPYATLHVLPRSGAYPIKIAMEQPWYRNLTLNTDISQWKVGMRPVLQWKMGELIAGTYGEQTMEGVCLRNYNKAMARFKRSNKKTLPYGADTSAPGMTQKNRFNIFSGDVF